MSLSYENEGGNRPIAPSGNHLSRLCQVIDLGTHVDPVYGGTKHGLLLGWELSDVLFDFGNGVDEPFMVYRKLTFSTGKKSNLRPILEGMIGKPFDPKDPTFNLKSLVENGQPCMISIVHVPGKESGQMFANVQAVTPIPAKLQVPPMHNQPRFFEVEMGAASKEFLSLPEWRRDQIRKCKEWTAPADPSKIEYDDDGQAHFPNFE